jgi:uncharacterized protein DUF3307
MFAEAFVTLYVAHHVGDYWVQTDHQARHKGDAGAEGRWHCWAHVLSYMVTQGAMLAIMATVLDMYMNPWKVSAALFVSAVTHYAADRREYGAVYWLARRIPGKANFLRLGMPHVRLVKASDGQIVGKVDDNPTLGTGAWALDQSWHIFWGVFVAALIVSY